MSNIANVRAGAARPNVLRAWRYSLCPKALKAFSLALPLGLCVVLAPSCARSGALHRNELGSASAVSPRSLPSNDGDRNLDLDEHGGRHNDGVEKERAAMASDSTVSRTESVISEVPARTLPSGTLVMVRVQDSLPLSSIHPGDRFTGCLAEPLKLNGNTLIESGDPVSGRIELVQPPIWTPLRGAVSGYLRLSLNSITVNGRTIPLKTSNLFARTNLPSTLPSVGLTSNREFHLQPGRRLTFRLILPLSSAENQSVARR